MRASVSQEYHRNISGGRPRAAVGIGTRGACTPGIEAARGGKRQRNCYLG